MAVRTSEAEWRGDLPSGQGTMKVGSGAYEGAYSFKSRFEEGTGTNPEELIGAAHAGCYSMALSNMLAGAGHTPTRVHTTARVTLEKGEGGFGISNIHLTAEAEVPGISPELFQEKAQAAKTGCPISKALAATNITLDARLTGS